MQYIGAKQSTLCHHLAGTRVLPGEPGLQLINMMAQLTRLPLQPVVQMVSAEEIAERQQAAQWCRTKCIHLQKKLGKMQKEAAQATHQLQFVDALENEEVEISKAKQSWYDSQRYTGRIKLEKKSRYRQIKLEAQIATLQQEAEVYEVQLKEV